jgi:hypothetical protein
MIVDIVVKIVELIRSLTFRDVALLTLLLLIAYPVWLTWIVLDNPEKIHTLFDVRSTYRVVGSVSECLLVTSRSNTEIGYEIVRVGGSFYKGDENVTLGIYVMSDYPFSYNQAKEVCADLTKANKILADHNIVKLISLNVPLDKPLLTKD